MLVFLLLNEALSFNHFLNSLQESKRGLPVSVAELVERLTDKHKNKGLNLAELVSGEHCRENKISKCLFNKALKYNNS